MKKFIVSLLTLMFAACSLAFILSGCGTPDSTVCITFVQSGQTDITRNVKKGGSLTDVPTPFLQEGYTVVWDTTDFSNIQKSFTVNAVATPNEYTIYYELENINATIIATTQTITFDSNVTLYKPTSLVENIVFDYYTIKGTEDVFSDGIYKIAGDVTLVAHWKIQDDGSEWSDLT